MAAKVFERNLPIVQLQKSGPIQDIGAAAHLRERAHSAEHATANLIFRKPMESPRVLLPAHSSRRSQEDSRTSPPNQPPWLLCSIADQARLWRRSGFNDFIMRGCSLSEPSGGFSFEKFSPFATEGLCRSLPACRCCYCSLAISFSLAGLCVRPTEFEWFRLRDRAHQL